MKEVYSAQVQNICTKKTIKAHSLNVSILKLITTPRLIVKKVVEVSRDQTLFHSSHASILVNCKKGVIHSNMSSSRLWNSQSKMTLPVMEHITPVPRKESVLTYSSPTKMTWNRFQFLILIGIRWSLNRTLVPSRVVSCKFQSLIFFIQLIRVQPPKVIWSEMNSSPNLKCQQLRRNIRNTAWKKQMNLSTKSSQKIPALQRSRIILRVQKVNTMKTLITNQRVK